MINHNHSYLYKQVLYPKVQVVSKFWMINSSWKLSRTSTVHQPRKTPNGAFCRRLGTTQKQIISNVLENVTTGKKNLPIVPVTNAMTPVTVPRCRSFL
jgi:hypothetical protein